MAFFMHLLALSSQLSVCDVQKGVMDPRSAILHFRHMNDGLHPRYNLIQKHKKTTRVATSAERPLEPPLGFGNSSAALCEPCMAPSEADRWL